MANHYVEDINLKKADMDRAHKLYGGEVAINFKDKDHSYWTTYDSPLKKDGTPRLRRLCGVTTFINVLDKPALIPWAVRTTVEFIRDHLGELKNDPDLILQHAREEADRQKDVAAEIGKAIHAWIEAHVKGDRPEMPDDENVLQGVVHFLNWVDEHNVKFEASEQIVYSKKHDYVGTLDIMAVVDGKRCLVDVKTGNGIYAEVKMQTAAYRHAWEEEHGEKIEGRWVWRISKETEEEYVARMEKKGKVEYAPFVPFEAVYLDAEAETQQSDFDGFLAAQRLYRWKAKASKQLG